MAPTVMYLILVDSFFPHPVLKRRSAYPQAHPSKSLIFDGMQVRMALNHAPECAVTVFRMHWKSWSFLLLAYNETATEIRPIIGWAYTMSQQSIPKDV